jgi:hypothetical protein
LQERRLRVRADVLGGLEDAERAATLGMDVALRHPFAVEVGHLAQEMEVVQQDRPVGADRQRELVAGRRAPVAVVDTTGEMSPFGVVAVTSEMSYSFSGGRWELVFPPVVTMKSWGRAR